MSRNEKAESQRETALTEHSIFAGLTFHGKPVSKEEYISHYEEYVRRCSDMKEANSLADELTPRRIISRMISTDEINSTVNGNSVSITLVSSNQSESFNESIFNRYFKFEKLKNAKKFKKNNSSPNYQMEIVALPSQETQKQIFGILFLRNNQK